MAHTILVADDSQTIRKIVEMALKASPYQIVEASSARATMDAVQRGPDLVLLDYFMPDGSGYEICRALKNNPATRHIPIVMMGGSFKNFDEAMARQMGADEVVPKPFKTAQLLSALESALARGGRSAGASAPPLPQHTPAPTSGGPAPPPNPFSASSARAGLSSPGLGSPSTPPPQRPNQSSPGISPGSQPRIPTPVPQRNNPATVTGSQPRIDPARPQQVAPAASGGLNVDRAELETMIREEVQRAVKEELPGLLRNVMGDLFQQKILPRLVKHSEERVNLMLDEQLSRRVQEQVRVELEHLLREE